MQARVNDFEYTKQEATFIGWLHGQHIFVALKDRQVQVEEADLDNIKVRKTRTASNPSAALPSRVWYASGLTNSSRAILA